MLSTILIDLRKERELSQQQLADATGISQSTIAKIEINRNEATASTLRKLSQFFGVSSDYLLGLEDDFGGRAPGRAVIERPAFDITDKQLVDVVKLFGVMTEIQKARVLGYIIAFLESEGVNVGKVLVGY